MRLSIFFFCALVFSNAAAMSQQLRLSDVEAPTLLIKNAEGHGYTNAATVKTVIETDVYGPLAHTRVRQLFRNDSKEWVEGVYVFPLPDTGAVDSLKMRVGERLLEGIVQEKEKAKRTYTNAKKQGKKAALMEAKRPNVFSTNVANIGPGETIAVEFGLREKLRFDNGAFKLRLPLVVAPRYERNVTHTKMIFADGSWQIQTNRNDGSAAVSPPVKGTPGLEPEMDNPVSITVNLNAGFTTAEVKSHHHKIKIEQRDGDKKIITLADSIVAADRDFELTWRAASQATPKVSFFRQSTDHGSYLMGFVLPPNLANPDSGSIARELVFVIDKSGSMGGTSIRQARDSLRLALATLTPRDIFNVIVFDSQPSALFSKSLTADTGNIQIARAFVDSLEAGGGTETASALRLAFKNPAMPNRLRQFVLITDGAIGDEKGVFKLIQDHLGDTRLFTVGIGSAPNSWFMKGTAEMGRGTYTFIGNPEQVSTRMNALIDQLRQPAMTDIAIETAEPTAKLGTPVIPDLYANQPLTFVLRAQSIPADISVKGRVGNTKWEGSVNTATAVEATGIDKLWAHDRITQLELGKRTGGDGTDIDSQILELGLEAQILTRLTSFVAVDTIVSRPKSEDMKLASIASNIPAGWAFEKVFGDAVKHATFPKAMPPQRGLDRSLDHASASNSSPVAQRTASHAQAMIMTPKGGTHGPAFIVFGCFLIIMSAGTALWVRRKFS